MLDVGCGNGRFLDFWSPWYDKIDMFDQCPVAVEDTKKRIFQLDLKRRASVTKHSIRTFPWTKYPKYDMIFMCHVVGYMNDDELV